MSEDNYLDGLCHLKLVINLLFRKVPGQEKTFRIPCAWRSTLLDTILVHPITNLHPVYSRCRSVFLKYCYCIPLKSKPKGRIGWYAIAVFLKNASTSRVPEYSSTRVGRPWQVDHDYSQYPGRYHSMTPACHMNAILLYYHAGTCIGYGK